MTTPQEIKAVARALADASDFDPDLEWRYFATKASLALAAVIPIIQTAMLREMLLVLTYAEDDPRESRGNFIRRIARERGLDIGSDNNE